MRVHYLKNILTFDFEIEIESNIIWYTNFNLILVLYLVLLPVDL